MKFKQALNEYIATVPHDEWLKHHKDLWMSLVNKGYTERNNTSLFLKFGKFIDSYYKENNKFPSIKEIINELNLNETLFIKTAGHKKTTTDEKDPHKKDYDDAVKGIKAFNVWKRKIRVKM